ncbi:MAG: response regulator transcription factor [Desulfobacteraceae bacterium]|jgi:DNA-binding response OmpR family regulator
MVTTKKSSTIFICVAQKKAAKPLSDYLTAKDFTVQCIQGSSQAVNQIITRAPDVVVLDVDLPMDGGYEVCSAVRSSFNGQILLMGSDRNEASQLLAFERGADDYILTPISPALLAARIGAHLKRSKGAGGNGNNRIRVGDLVVDAGCREVFLAGKSIDLTTIQFELLWYLAKRSGRVVSREELFEALYDEKYNRCDRSVDVYISRIRNQLGENADKPSYLKTVRGVGYLFVGHSELKCRGDYKADCKVTRRRRVPLPS